MFIAVPSTFLKETACWWYLILNNGVNEGTYCKSAPAGKAINRKMKIYKLALSAVVLISATFISVERIIIRFEQDSYKLTDQHKSYIIENVLPVKNIEPSYYLLIEASNAYSEDSIIVEYRLREVSTFLTNNGYPKEKIVFINCFDPESPKHDYLFDGKVPASKIEFSWHLPVEQIKGKNRLRCK